MSTSSTILLVAAIAGLAIGAYVLTRPGAALAPAGGGPPVIHTGGTGAAAGQREAAPATGAQQGTNWGAIATAGANIIGTLASIDWDGSDDEDGFVDW